MRQARFPRSLPGFRSVLLASLCLPGACGVSAAVAAEAGAKIVASVGGEQFTLEEFSRRNPAFSTWLGTGVLSVEEVEDRVGEMLFGRFLAAEAKRMSLDQEVTVALQIEDVLAEAYLRARIPESAMRVEDEDVRAAYDEQRDERFALPQKLKLAHTVVASEREAKALRATLGSGADFQSAVTHSLDPASAGSGGELGWVAVDKLSPALAEAVATLAAGELSEVVETEFGYHILKVLERAPREYQPYETVRGRLRGELTRSRQDELVDAIKQELFAKYQPVINRETVAEAVAASGNVVMDDGSSEQPPQAELSLLSEFYNLGALAEGTTTLRTLVANVGDAELTIKKVFTDCPCLEARIEPEALEPGQVGELSITLDRELFKESGANVRKVAIETNDTRRPRRVVEVASEVPERSNAE